MIDRSQLFRSVNYQTVDPVPTTDNPDLRPRECETLLIIGASARQYAESANRAGIVCSTVDLFSDWDLQLIADTHVVQTLEDFDASSFFSSLPKLPDRFVICGGMEKRPQLISEISQHLPYVGVCPKQIERLNDPFAIAGCCASNRIAFPTVRRPGYQLDQSEVSWLLKPDHSAGGANIRHWQKKDHSHNEAKRPTAVGTAVSAISSAVGTGIESGFETISGFNPLAVGSNFYQQAFVAGQSYSSLFCSDARTTHLIGSTIQLVGLPPFSNRPFAYCGSIGPVDLCRDHRDELERIGNILAGEFQLAGIFGIDWVLDASEKIWLIEVNPRMTASAEIFELAGCVRSITRLHLDSAAGVGQFALTDHDLLFGKAILFSDSSQSITINQDVFDYFCGMETIDSHRSVADIPKTGTRIGRGEPILTLFASGNSETELRSRLHSKAGMVRREMVNLQRRH